MAHIRRIAEKERVSDFLVGIETCRARYALKRDGYLFVGGKMFAELPNHVKQEILYFFQNNDFPKAKIIHDEWVAKQKTSTPAQQPQSQP